MRSLVLVPRAAPLWGALLLLLTATTAAGMTDLKILQEVDDSIAGIEEQLQKLAADAAMTTPIAETSTATTAETSTSTSIGAKALYAPVTEEIKRKAARSGKKAVARLSTPFTAQPFATSTLSDASCITNPQVAIIVSAVAAVYTVSDEIASGKIYEKQATIARDAESSVTKQVETASEELKRCVRDNKEIVDQMFELLQSAQSKVSSKLNDKLKNRTFAIIIGVVGGAVLLAIIVGVSVFIVKRKKKHTDVIKKTEEERTPQSKLDDSAPMQQDPENSDINHGIENYGFDRTPIMAPFKAINAHKPSAQQHPSIIPNESTWDPPLDQNPRQDVGRQQEQHPYGRNVRSFNVYDNQAPQSQYVNPYDSKYEGEPEKLPRTEVRGPGSRFQAERQGDTRSNLRHHDNTYNRAAKSYYSDEERTKRHSTYDSKNNRDPRSHYSDEDTVRRPRSRSRQTDYKRDHPRRLSPQGRPSHNPYGDSDPTYITKPRHSKAQDNRRPRDEPRPSRRTPSPRRSYRTDEVARHAPGGAPNRHHSPYKNSIPRITLERDRARDAKDTVPRSQFRRPYGYEDLI